MKIKQKLKIMAVVLLSVVFQRTNVCLAEMSTSNFKITSDVIGSFGTKENSASFELGDTGGEVGTGSGSSTNFNLDAGFWNAVGDDSVLIFDITQDTANLGQFSQAEVKYGTVSFQVATTAQGGYAVHFSGEPLSFEDKTISPLTVAATSDPGTEQFGFNLVANSTPGIGVDPVGGIGQVSLGYNTPNLFKFIPGDKIAESPGPSNLTNYMMSFIANVTETSAAGEYFSHITIVATGRY